MASLLYEEGGFFYVYKENEVDSDSRKLQGDFRLSGKHVLFCLLNLYLRTLFIKRGNTPANHARYNRPDWTDFSVCDFHF
jgi:hypothetical protein